MLRPGDSFSLASRQSAPVFVTEAAPLPLHAGTLAFGPPYEGQRCPDVGGGPREVLRDVFFIASPELEPWLSLTRTTLESTDGAWGGLVGADVTPLGRRVGFVALTCAEPLRREFPLVVNVDIAGADTQPPPLTTTLVLDCADLPPRGCSTGLGVAPALLLLGLIRRRRL